VSTSIVIEGLDVDDHGHVLVKLSGTPPDQWMEAFRDYWARPDTSDSAAVKKDAFSHFDEATIVFRGVDVDGFVAHCKALTQNAVNYANDETQRVEAERDARIRGQAGDPKHIEAERAKARKVKFE
jgi:hypothetical protein